MSDALDAAIDRTAAERATAYRFYQWALLAVILGVITMIGLGLWVTVQVHTINTRGAHNEQIQLCEANAEGTIARDVHYLIAHNGGGPSTLYVIPKTCQDPPQ